MSVLDGCCEIIKGRLYYAVVPEVPTDDPRTHYFSIDTDLMYEAFFADFGPLHLGHLYRFSRKLCRVLQDPTFASKRIVFCAGKDPHPRTNAAVLIGGWAIIYLGMDPVQAYRRLGNYHGSYVPFRDPSMGVCTFHVTVLDCLRAVYKATLLKWLDFETFDVEEYDHYERVENGDLNWIVPNKFVHFSGPAACRMVNAEGWVMLGPEDYIPIFQQMGVTSVIRFNKKAYEKQTFIDAGINHHDMYFLDGGCPSEAIVERFIEVCEQETGAIAIHCKAGLGRTGTLTACYLMKHFRWSAHEIVAWLRICRPGSVIGPQQQFLRQMEPLMWKAGEEWLQQKGCTPVGGPTAKNLPWTRSPGSSQMPGALGRSVEDNMKQYMGNMQC